MVKLIWRRNEVFFFFFWIGNRMAKRIHMADPD